MLEPLTRDVMLAELNNLAVAFPRRSGEDPAVLARVYFESLRHFPADAVRHAVRQAIQNGQHFPRVADLRETATKWQRANAAAVVPFPGDDPDRCHICGCVPVPTPSGRRTERYHDRRAHGIFDLPGEA